MKTTRFTRRDALKAGAALAASPAIAPLARAGEKAAPAWNPAVGVSTLGFGGYTNAQLADELAAEGITLIQLFLNQSDSRYWKYNGRTDLSDLTPDRCKAIAGTYRSKGIAIDSIGVYTNLIHPDPGERAANLAYFEGMMRAGAAMGVRTFITEAGHYHDEGRTPHHFKTEVWPQMVETAKQLAALAEAHDAKVLCEPYFMSFFASAKRTRVFLEEVGSPRIRALLDPANILEVNDLDEMFEQLGPYIDCMHAKDRKLHVERGVAAGQGDVDYDRFVDLAATRAPDAPFILEYVGPDDYKQALAVLQGALDRRGA
jgi:sugar phosphate isomerase/epimerase